MAKATENVIIPNALGYVEQKIKNVQDTAKAVLTEAEYTYRYPVLSKATQTYKECLELLDNAFQSIYSKLESIKLEDSNGDEITVIDFLDYGKDGITFKVFSDLPDITMNLLTEGSLYSSASKDYLIENTLDETGEKILSAKDFENKKDSSAKSVSAKPAVKVTVEGSTL